MTQCKTQLRLERTEEQEVKQDSLDQGKTVTTEMGLELSRNSSVRSDRLCETERVRLCTRKIPSNSLHGTSDLLLYRQELSDNKQSAVSHSLIGAFVLSVYPFEEKQRDNVLVDGCVVIVAGGPASSYQHYPMWTRRPTEIYGEFKNPKQELF